MFRSLKSSCRAPTSIRQVIVEVNIFAKENDGSIAYGFNNTKLITRNEITLSSLFLFGLTKLKDFILVKTRKCGTDLFTSNVNEKNL